MRLFREPPAPATEAELALLRDWRAAGKNDSGTTAVWRARWCQYVLEDMAANPRNYGPVNAAKHVFPPVGQKGLPHEQPLEPAAQLVADQTVERCRLWDARDESARRLRTTLQCEAWLRALDVTHPLLDRLFAWHQRAWGITDPASDDVAEREAVIARCVREKVQ